MNLTRFRLAYTICTPECESVNDLAHSAPLEEALAQLPALGYDGVELQVRDPGAMDQARLTAALQSSGLQVAAVATGHIVGDDGLSTTASPWATSTPGSARRPSNGSRPWWTSPPPPRRW